MMDRGRTPVMRVKDSGLNNQVHGSRFTVGKNLKAVCGKGFQPRLNRGKMPLPQ
jgi:hypothetical protein